MFGNVTGSRWALAHILVVLGLVFPYQAKRLASAPWERLRNDLFCVEWDVRLQLNQSVRELPQTEHLSGIGNQHNNQIMNVTVF